MPPTFAQLTLTEFAVLLERFPFTRKINAVHMHHTWRPNHSQYKGHDSIVSMWRYHTQEKGWDDIAQHLTIAPDGTLWLGRNWNAMPISAKGHNGNERVGPFMFEMIGDFDAGMDPFSGAQRDAAFSVVALVQKRFSLAPETLHFHNQMSPKSCPGTTLDYEEILEEVRKRHTRTVPTLTGGKRGELQPFSDAALYISQLADSLKQRSARATPSDDELDEASMTTEDRYSFYHAGNSDARGGLVAGAVELTPEMKAELRPHVINLVQGQFSNDGAFSTTAADVDAIFNEHLKDALVAAKAKKQPLRIVFHAHGGLVSEKNGLWRAYKDFKWWKDNGVYPIYFTWETGLLEIIGQLLTRSRQLAQPETRDVWDVVADPVLEELGRALGGVTIWSGMKRSAELASADDGGAHYTAEQLKKFLSKNKAEGNVEIHAFGHSAGAIFQSHFLPLLVARDIPIQTTHLLAPALRVDAFLERLAPHMKEKELEHVTIFTMKKDLELADNCITLYHKSLLYLIHYAFESERKTPILGLEVSLRDNTETRKLFGLEGKSSSKGEVIWSTTASSSGRCACEATAHGAFNDDQSTMNSVMRRVLDVGDQDPIVGYPDYSSRAIIREEAFDWPEGLERGRPTPPSPPSWTTLPPLEPRWGSSRTISVTPISRYQQRALCIGINAYPAAPLSGCVADAELWSKTLRRLGFETTLLTDRLATRDKILAALDDLLRSSRAGDVVVFQYAGHGTSLPDLNGDELGEDTPNTDEALCPVDYDKGAFLIDDDLAEVFARTPDRVNVTCFMDCCYSGTITRLLMGGSPVQARGNEHQRFLQANDTMIEQHRRFRETGQGRALGMFRGAPRGPEQMREVVFSACQSSEVAWESSDQGDFTLRATRLLENANSLTHEDFESRVIGAFGTNPRQRPLLDCSPAARTRLLLQPLAEGGKVAPPRGNLGLAQRLHQMANELEQQG